MIPAAFPSSSAASLRPAPLRAYRYRAASPIAVRTCGTPGASCGATGREDGRHPSRDCRADRRGASHRECCPAGRRWLRAYRDLSRMRRCRICRASAGSVAQRNPARVGPRSPPATDRDHRRERRWWVCHRYPSLETPLQFHRTQSLITHRAASCPMCVIRIARARLRRLNGAPHPFIVGKTKRRPEGRPGVEAPMADVTAGDEIANDARVRFNVVRLAAAQALTGANSAVIFATGSIVGATLAPNVSLATVPLSMYVLGLAARTLPGGALSRGYGRWGTFILGTRCGMRAVLIASFTLHHRPV